jgi:hypothetical protein
MSPDEYRSALEQSARSASDASVELSRRRAAAVEREASPTATAPSASPDMQESNLAERPQPAVSP